MSLWRRIYHERRAIVLPLVLVLLANAAVLTLAVFPMVQNVAGLEADAQTATFELAKAKLVDKQAKDRF